jgi:hypothetical protein
MAQGAVTTGLASYTNGQVDPLSLTTTGLLRVDGSNVTQPISGSITVSGTTTVSGTVTANQGGTWTVQPGNTANTTAWLVTGTGGTFPVTGTVTANQGGTWNITNVSGTVSLPTGAATSANQPSAATSGSTSSGQTGTVAMGFTTTGAPTYTTAQTNPLSLTTAGALRVDGSAVTQPVSAASLPLPTGASTSANQPTNAAQGSTTSGQTGTLALGAVTTASPTYTTGQTSPFSLDTTGALRVNVTAGSGGGGTASSFGAAFPATGTAAGGEYLSSPPTLTTGQMVALQTNVNGSLKVDGSAVTQPVSGTVTANQGGAPWSENITQFGGVALATGVGASGTGIPRVTVANDSNILATQSGTWTVQPGNTANTTPWLVTEALTAAANGLTSSRVNSAASTNATSLKASAGNLGRIDVFNTAAYAVFLKIYNKASAPTVGTDTPVWTIPVASGGGYSTEFMRGKSLATGIAYAITKLQADSDTTAVAAADLTGSIDWI